MDMDTNTGNLTKGQAAGWAANGTQPSIAIIGAGMSGIAAVVKLREAGYTDLTVYEKADRVGGTWRENQYPGLSCDVPSRWYSFSFALNPDWTHRFSYGPEIQAYMEKTAKDFGVTDIVKFNTAVTDLSYEGPQWRLTTGDGETVRYDIVISATGVLHKPSYPNIDGLDTFKGDMFHTARWDHSVPLEGRKVGIIGTGSTAAQIVGAITPKVGTMNVFQRTPQWMIPLPQRRYTAFTKWLMRTFPVLQRVTYDFYYKTMCRNFGAATTGDQKKLQKIQEACTKHLNEAVADPELRKKLTPDYQAACKRLIFCSDFYPAITSDNANLITEGIKRIVPEGIETEDGVVHELDVLVLATGFDAGAFILPTKVTGENGRDLEAVWHGSPRAHRAVSVPGFPNFWMLEGPTGPVGNLSLITISERQIDYVISMLDKMRDEGLAGLVPTESAFEAYNEALRQRVPQTVWASGGCDSWYFDASGTPNLYPFPPEQYLADMHNPDFSEYRKIEPKEFEAA
ncbi:MAG: NAD(P)/FAD-dependent oxidoreductase [Parvibaculaceae bacterium]